jgi:4-amino-4-deoxy-L-arabinose transferase-like glycosyltransferase
MLAGAAACIALGTMSKGPAGALLPGLALAGFLLLRGRLRELVSPGILIAFASGLSVWLIWSIAAYRVGGNAFFQYQIVKGLALRFLPNALGGDGNCRYEPYIYAKVIFSQCLPWSLFLPALIALLISQRASIPEPLLFAACWFVAVLTFFTVSSGRCTVYILPCVPPMALMLAYLFTRMDREPTTNSIAVMLFNVGSLLVALGTLALLTLAALVLGSGIPENALQQLHATDRALLAMLRDLGPNLYLWMALSAIGGVTLVMGALGARPGRSARGLLIISLAGTFFWFHSIVPAVAQRRTFKGFAATIDSMVPSGAVIEYLGADTPCDLRFYLVHQLDSRRLASSTSPFIVIGESDFRRLDPSRRASLQLLANSASAGLNSSPLMLMRTRDLRP